MLAIVFLLGLASFFGLLASIVHFNIIAAIIFFLATAILWAGTYYVVLLVVSTSEAQRLRQYKAASIKRLQKEYDS